MAGVEKWYTGKEDGIDDRSVFYIATARTQVAYSNPRGNENIVHVFVLSCCFYRSLLSFLLLGQSLPEYATESFAGKSPSLLTFYTSFSSFLLLFTSQVSYTIPMSVILNKSRVWICIPTSAVLCSIVIDILFKAFVFTPFFIFSK